MEATFKSVSDNDHAKFFGDRALIISGYQQDEINIIKQYTNKVLGNVKLCFISEKNYQNKIEEIIQSEEQQENFEYQKAIILGGIKQKELHYFISNFKYTKLARPLFAAMTEHNAKWNFSDLVEELAKEREEISRQLQERRKQNLSESAT